VRVFGGANRAEKTIIPSTTLTFAGIELDTNTMETRLPADKILKTRSILSEFLCRRKETLQEMCGVSLI
jgi:hypothetical protein